jgi:hypothetical protein
MVTDTADWEDTKPGIILAELRDRARETRADIKAHDGEIRTLQSQVARVDERVKFLNRAFWLIATGIGGLLVDAVMRHLR